MPVASLLVEVDWCSQGFVLYLAHSPVSLHGTIVHARSGQVGHNSDQPLIESLLERKRKEGEIEQTPMFEAFHLRASSQFEPADHSFGVTLQCIGYS